MSLSEEYLIIVLDLHSFYHFNNHIMGMVENNMWLYDIFMRPVET